MTATILLLLKSATVWLGVGVLGSALEKAGLVRVGRFLEALAVDVPKLLGGGK